MAITQRAGVNTSQASANWRAGMAAGGTKWANGVRAPRALPNANPGKNAAAWQAGVAAALPAFTAGISGANYLTKLEAGLPAGQTKFGAAATSRGPQFDAAITALKPLIDAAVAALPPKGPKGTNSNRASAFGQAMHANKGKAKAPR